MTDARGRGSEAGELRPLLFSIAYRMLASVAEAEDVVQETYLRYERALADGATVASPKAYLSAVVTRLARSSVSSGAGSHCPLAFLLLLERLSPVERAVFLLHDVFGYEHREIADIVGKSDENCRQIARAVAGAAADRAAVRAGGRGVLLPRGRRADRRGVGPRGHPLEGAAARALGRPVALALGSGEPSQ